MLSVFLFIAFAGSAGAFGVAPQMPVRRTMEAASMHRMAVLTEAPTKSPLTINRFECGVCGGSGDFCPVCRGPALLTLDMAEPATSRSMCDCGGSGCSSCLAPSAASSPLSYECGCGGMGCSMCQGP